MCYAYVLQQCSVRSGQARAWLQGGGSLRSLLPSGHLLLVTGWPSSLGSLLYTVLQLYKVAGVV